MKIRLDAVIKNLSVANAAIKNTASPIAKDGWYPAFSASGQDVWLPDYRFDHRGIVVSAVGARCGKAFKADGKWNICANTHALSVDESIADRDYCWYILNNETWWIKGGTVQPFVKVKDSLKREHLFPSLDEQSRIVQVLDQVSHILDMRQKELLFLDNMIKARFVEMFGTYPANEKGWGTGTIRDLISEVRYGSSRKAADGDSGQYPYLRMNNITYSGELDLSDTKTIDIPDEELPKYTVRRGDVLFNRTNSKELVGKTCVYNRDEMMVLAGFIVRVRVNDRILPEILSAFLNTDFSKQMLLAMCKAAIGQANINAQELQSIGIYIPPIELQKEFVAFKEQLDKSKVAVRKALDEAQLLFDSLMQQYFG